MRSFMSVLVAIVAVLLMAMIAAPSDATVDVSGIYFTSELPLRFYASVPAFGEVQGQPDLVTMNMVSPEAETVSAYYDTGTSLTGAAPTSATEHILHPIGHRSARLPANPQPARILRA